MTPIETNSLNNLESNLEPTQPAEKNLNTPGRLKLKSWLNKNFRIKLSDGRILIGLFLCTDADANIILGMCSEFREEEERSLGLVIVPKKHIVSIEVDKSCEDII